MSMTEPEGRFAPKREDVAAKVIDGELIAIRLSDGTYYSMDPVGTRVWELLEAGHELSAVVASIAADYAVPAERVARDLRDLARDLLAESLIVPAGAGGTPAAPAALPAGTAPYQPPRLNIYRDMGNLLALDPPTPGIDDLLFRDGKTE
jgi:hypothetical protein